MSAVVSMTGLKAAQYDLSVTSNNIANVKTSGFHSSRANFGDIYAQSPYTDRRVQVGRGVQLQSMSGNFSQGSVSQTANSLDMAIEGQGYFIKRSGEETGQIQYTRAGAFGLDDQGYIVDNSGNYLMARAVAEDGGMLASTNQDLNRIAIPMQSGVPEATTAVEISVNFSTNEFGRGNQSSVPAAAAFDFMDDTTYAQRTPIEVYDELGQPKSAHMYFIQTQEASPADLNTAYEVRLVIENTEVPIDNAGDNILTFDEFGAPTTPIAPMTFGSPFDSLIVDMDGTRLSRENYAVQTYDHNGETLRGLSSLEVDSTGVIWATYLGEEAVALGRVAMANFNNPNGLKRVGQATYMETSASGAAFMGEPGDNGFGSIRASALEGSNVELTSELVNLITAQRNYQANAKALETSNSMAQTILQMRS